MKAAVFYEKEKIVVEEVPVQEPGDYEVRIRVKAAGVCGTDMHIFAGDESKSGRSRDGRSEYLLRFLLSVPQRGSPLL